MWTQSKLKNNGKISIDICSCYEARGQFIFHFFFYSYSMISKNFHCHPDWYLTRDDAVVQVNHFVNRLSDKPTLILSTY